MATLRPGVGSALPLGVTAIGRVDFWSFPVAERQPIGPMPKAAATRLQELLSGLDGQP